MQVDELARVVELVVSKFAKIAVIFWSTWTDIAGDERVCRPRDHTRQQSREKWAFRAHAIDRQALTVRS